MLTATAVIVGILITVAGTILSSMSGFFFIGLAGHMVKPKKVKPAKSLFAGGVSVFGILLLAAGPLTALWGGIATGLAIIGA